MSINSDHRFSAEDLILNGDYVGEGYGIVGELEKEAISLIAENEAILLDPVYTGRAVGALIDLIRGGEFSKSDKVLFGIPAGIQHCLPMLEAYFELQSLFKHFHSIKAL